MPRSKNFKLDLRMEEDNTHQPQAPWLPRSKVKVARSSDQSEPSWPNAVSVSLEAGVYHVGRTRRPHVLLFPDLQWISTMGAFINVFRSCSFWIDPNCLRTEWHRMAAILCVKLWHNIRQYGISLTTGQQTFYCKKSDDIFRETTFGISSCGDRDTSQCIIVTLTKN